MADLIIRGMEMPKDNNAISIVIFSNGKVSLAHDKTYAEYAEAIPIPDGYGRLIDADALICDKSCEATLWCGYEYQDHPIVFVEDILTAPTIVPAEGGTGNADPAN